ncbi:hypothetical protein J2046_002731 [Rhizobium petrolearium]|uniref:hypothetical protein n=1 Tax=Neorhizobium petrolearium TaxID=515361 RepID=UPI001AE8AAA9|nr:hypothetical protein [Neorhizobium petrolearium]MBP1844472.1 hypothetical protein [Neorhizobium petrolearium]
MPLEKLNPAGGGSRSRVSKFDVPRRKFDNDQNTVFTLGRKGTEGITRHVQVSGKVIDGGARILFTYEDGRGHSPAPAYRVYRVHLGGGRFYELCPIEDLVLYLAPRCHDDAKYRHTCIDNALARTEWRRIAKASCYGTYADFGFRSEEEFGNFWAYLSLIESDDHEAITHAGLTLRDAECSENFRDSRLILSEWRHWWRAPL